ncbi:MAG: hypothetical protein QXT77_07015 [Candidatus Methanomethylicaceae archaeon]
MKIHLQKVGLDRWRIRSGFFCFVSQNWKGCLIMKKKLVGWLVAYLVFVLVTGNACAQVTVIDNIVEGDKTITTDTQLLSIIRGNVIVNSGITFQLDGIVTGDVVVNERAVLVLNGIVNGNITLEKGAIIELNGIVGGNIYNRSGNAIDPGVIKGIVKGEVVDL